MEGNAGEGGVESVAAPFPVTSKGASTSRSSGLNTYKLAAPGVASRATLMCTVSSVVDGEVIPITRIPGLAKLTLAPGTKFLPVIFKSKSKPGPTRGGSMVVTTGPEGTADGAGAPGEAGAEGVSGAEGFTSAVGGVAGSAGVAGVAGEVGAGGVAGAGGAPPATILNPVSAARLAGLLTNRLIVLDCADALTFS